MAVDNVKSETNADTEKKNEQDQSESTGDMKEKPEKKKSPSKKGKGDSLKKSTKGKKHKEATTEGSKETKLATPKKTSKPSKLAKEKVRWLWKTWRNLHIYNHTRKKRKRKIIRPLRLPASKHSLPSCMILCSLSL